MAKITYEDLKSILKVTPPDISVGIYGFHGCGKTQCATQAGALMGYKQISILDMGIVGDAGDILGNPLTASRSKTRVKIVEGQPARNPDGSYEMETYESAYTDYAEPYWWPKNEAEPVFLIVDEANRIANRSVQNAMMRLINEKKVGNRQLHPDSRIIATFNPTGYDQYHVQEWDIAYRSRFMTYEFQPSAKEWMAEGEHRGYHPDIMRYIANYPNELLPWSSDEEMNAIKENSQTKNGRAWEKVSKIMCDANWSKEYGGKMAKFKTVVAGAVGYQGAEKFLQYLSTQNRIDIDDLLRDYSKHKAKVEAMTNFEQAMLVRDVIEHLKHSREDAKALKTLEKGLLDFMASVRAENSNVGYGMLYDSIKTWGATIYKNMPSLLKLRSYVLKL